MSRQEGSPVPHVCVVGAGIAGLRCATILVSYGLKVTILEARERIGGRIWQSNELGYPLDIGPNWIYTSSGEDHPIMKLARQAGASLHRWSDSIRLFGSNGNPVEPTRALRLQNLVWSFFEDSFRYSAEHGPEIPISASLYEFVQKCIAECDVSDDDRELLVGLSEIWGNYTGDPIQKQSLKYAWTEMVCSGGDEYFVTSDFSSILAKAAEGLLEMANIHLGAKVTHVRSQASANETMRRVEIGTHGGELWSFDEVVITCPLGWLKMNQQAFEPPLDSRLVESFDAISVGHLEKVYITFPKAFWRCEAGEQENLLDHTIWLSPRYAPHTNPFCWPLEAYDLAAYGPKSSYPTLLMYTFGDLSAHISSIVHHHPDRETQYTLLDRFFEPYYSRLPHYNLNNPDCRPKGYLATKWRYDELAGYGSYCNMQVGIDRANEHIHRIQNGMLERGILFAGEHAAPTEERGTVAGAWMSGEMVAEKLLAKYGRIYHPDCLRLVHSK